MDKNKYCQWNNCIDDPRFFVSGCERATWNDITAAAAVKHLREKEKICYGCKKPIIFPERFTKEKAINK